jgi:hypothetical protein
LCQALLIADVVRILYVSQQSLAGRAFNVADTGCDGEFHRHQPSFNFIMQFLPRRW